MTAPKDRQPRRRVRSIGHLFRHDQICTRMAHFSAGRSVSKIIEGSTFMDLVQELLGMLPRLSSGKTRDESLYRTQSKRVNDSNL